MRNLLVILVILVALTLATWCAAANPTTVSCPSAMLGTGITAAGIVPKAVVGHGQTSLTIQVRATAGTATAAIVACCFQGPTGCDLTTGTWSAVSAAGSLSTTTPVILSILDPAACLYSVSITAPSGLTADAVAACGGP